MYSLGSRCPFTKVSYTVAGLVLREQSQAVDAHDGSEQDHSPAKIGYTTPRDAIRCAGASTWTVVVAGPAPASDTVFLYGVP